MKDKIKLWAFSLILMTLVLPENYNSTAIILLAVLSLVKYREFKVVKLKKLLPSVIIFIVAAVGLSWSNDIDLGVKNLGKLHLFVTLPILLSFHSLSLEEINKINAHFLIWLSVVVIYYFSRCLFNIFVTGDIYIHEGNTTYYHFLYTRLSPDIPPTYFSLFLAYILFFCIKRYVFLKEYLGEIVVRFCILLLSLFFILLFARGVQIIFFFLLFLYLIKSGLFKRKLVFIPILSLFVVLFFLKDHRVFNRYNRVLQLESFTYKNIVRTLPSFGFRARVIKSTVENYQLYIPIGKGTGSQKKELKRFIDRRWKGMNSHNQIIEFYLQWGILGLIIYLFLFYDMLLIGKKSNYEFVLFIILLFIFSFTENIFARQKGIVITLLTYYFIKESSIKNLLNTSKHKIK